jgi:tetratricopeptide (TPR) repeat protein
VDGEPGAVSVEDAMIEKTTGSAAWCVAAALALGGCGWADEPTPGETPGAPGSELERSEDAVQAEPDWSELSRSRLEAEQWEEAAPAAQRAIELAGDAPHADDVETLAQARFGAERWEEARDAYARLVALDPARGAARIQLGRAEEQLGHDDAAEAAYRAAVDGDPEGVEAPIQLATLLVRRAGGRGDEDAIRRRQEARALFGRARERLGGCPEPEGDAPAAEDEERAGRCAAIAAALHELDARAAVDRSRRGVQQMLRGLGASELVDPSDQTIDDIPARYDAVGVQTRGADRPGDHDEGGHFGRLEPATP